MHARPRLVAFLTCGVPEAWPIRNMPGTGVSWNASTDGIGTIGGGLSASCMRSASNAHACSHFLHWMQESKLTTRDL